jgi:hypothetical protein
MLVRELSGMKVRDGLPVVFEADDEWILDSHLFPHDPASVCNPVKPVRALSAR